MTWPSAIGVGGLPHGSELFGNAVPIAATGDKHERRTKGPR